MSTCYALQVERVGVLACTPPLRARPPLLFGLFPRRDSKSPSFISDEIPPGRRVYALLDWADAGDQTDVWAARRASIQPRLCRRSKTPRITLPTTTGGRKAHESRL